MTGWPDEYYKEKPKEVSDRELMLLLDMRAFVIQLEDVLVRMSETLDLVASKEIRKEIKSSTIGENEDPNPYYKKPSTITREE